MKQAAVYITAIPLLLSACGYPDRAVFVTNTSVGIDADAATQKIGIGYDRTETFVGPIYDSGAIPPVVAEIESNLSIENPRVRQVYATGDAALVVSNDKFEPKPKELLGVKRVMFFGTHSNTGLQVTFVDHLPRAISFGYKRKELSIIPIVHPGDSERETYGSVLASICMHATVGNEQTTGIQLRQFIATGEAAEKMAAKRAVRKYFGELATSDADGQVAKTGEDDACRATAVLANSLAPPDQTSTKQP